MQQSSKKNETSELERLVTLRDELRVQVHLFDAEMKQEWEKLEKDWQLIEGEIRRITPDARKTLSPLLNRAGMSLARIREGLRRHHRSAS